MHRHALPYIGAASRIAIFDSVGPISAAAGNQEKTPSL
jgi:hypothetical protein